MFEEPDYQLTWPKPVFLTEAETVLQRAVHSGQPDEMELLLSEAFAGDAAADRFRAGDMSTRRLRSSIILDVEGATGSQFFEALVEEGDRLREQTERRPYYRERTAGPAPQSPLSIASVKERFARLVRELYDTGYLDRRLPQACVDDPDRFRDPEAVLADALDGTAGLWPLRPGTWDDRLFYDLVEVFHDLVARPRRRWWHDYGGCGWHYTEFAIAPARRIYRWQVNRLLDRSVVPYRLADDGEDEGRLVAVTDDARADLLAAMTARPADASSREKVGHAIALFRGRGASLEERRSAVGVLADVLEPRRQLLKDRLTSRDEGALFEIANRFAIRHNDEAQQGSYDPVFLDWLFWWYLATVELTDRLTARPQS